MPDYNRSNTVEDLLRRYNFEGTKQTLKQIQGNLTNTNGILEEFVDVTTENMDLIKDQLDGNVTSWFYGYVPTLYNYPASSWTTDDERKNHLEDLFYNTDTGKVYKFVKTSGKTNIFNPRSANVLLEEGRTGVGTDLLTHNLISGTDSKYQAIYIPCEHNSEYVITGTPVNPSNSINIHTSSTVEFTNHRIVTNSYQYTYDTITINTGDTDNYIIIQTFINTGSTLQDFLNSMTVIADGDYYWAEVTNIIGAQSLAVASASQDIQDGNRRTFVVQPTPPYDIGDLWCDNTNHILYRCYKTKETGESFSMDDWVNSLNYLTNDGDKLVDSINNRTTTKTISADRLFIEGDEINLTTKDLEIKSTYFRVDKYGNMECQKGTFRGEVTLYDQDVSHLLIKPFQIFGDHVYNGFTHTAELVMESNHLNMNYDQGSWGSDIGMGIVDDEAYIILAYDTAGKVTKVSSNGITTTGTVDSVNGVCQGSLAELKTDFEKLPSGLDIIRDINIYKYRYKDQEGDKKHIGFVIGDDYKYSESVTNSDNNGVDLYSFISVCCKAIQEQQEEIEELKKEISLLRKDDENDKIR